MGEFKVVMISGSVQTYKDSHFHIDVTTGALVIHDEVLDEVHLLNPVQWVDVFGTAEAMGTQRHRPPKKRGEADRFLEEKRLSEQRRENSSLAENQRRHADVIHINGDKNNPLDPNRVPDKEE